MKKNACLSILFALILSISSIGTVSAEILPPYGEGQYGLMAFVLCEELTVREKASSSSKTVTALPYGSRPIVVRQSGNRAYCVLGDSEDSASGWVNADYLAIDPAWLRTEAKSPVYAWNDLTAPKVALIDADTILPILRIDEDWILVSLRGAAGWIHR